MDNCSWLISMTLIILLTNIQFKFQSELITLVDDHLYGTGGFVRGLFVRQVGNLVGVVSWHVGSGVGTWHVGSGVGERVGTRDGFLVGFCVSNVG